MLAKRFSTKDEYLFLLTLYANVFFTVVIKIVLKTWIYQVP